MADGFDFIHQASMCHGGMRGSADLLRKIDQPSALGDWSYIPIECKLASKPKTTFLVQASAYCELLTPLLGHRPDQFELYLGGGKFQRYATDQFWAWYQLLRQRFAAFQQSFDPNQPPEDAPGDHGGCTAFIDERLEQQRDEGVRPPSCHLAQHSDNRATTLIPLLESCGRPAATIPASTW